MAARFPNGGGGGGENADHNPYCSYPRPLFAHPFLAIWIWNLGGFEPPFFVG